MNSKQIFFALIITIIIWGVINFGVGDSGDVKEFDVVMSKFKFEHNISANVGDTLRLKVSSSDVAHGIYLPDYGINEMVLPGQTKTIEFKVTKPGQVRFACSVMCGAGHMGMKSSFIVNK